MGQALQDDVHETRVTEVIHAAEACVEVTRVIMAISGYYGAENEWCCAEERARKIRIISARVSMVHTYLVATKLIFLPISSLNLSGSIRNLCIRYQLDIYLHLLLHLFLRQPTYNHSHNPGRGPEKPSLSMTGFEWSRIRRLSDMAVVHLSGWIGLWGLSG